MNLTRTFALALILAGTIQAGPAIACNWEAVPGSVFSTLGPLRDRAYYADDSPAAAQKALAELAQLRASIQPADALSLLRAGFWAATMHDVRVSQDTDGPALILRAVALKPNDAEYHVFAALAHMSTDKAIFHKHWTRARQLAKPGSAADINIRLIAKQYASEIAD
jgi:hypothetical protein